jgi:hypothetical protein
VAWLSTDHCIEAFKNSWYFAYCPKLRLSPRLGRAAAPRGSEMHVTSWGDGNNSIIIAIVDHSVCPISPYWKDCSQHSISTEPLQELFARPSVQALVLRTISPLIPVSLCTQYLCYDWLLSTSRGNRMHSRWLCRRQFIISHLPGSTKQFDSAAAELIPSSREQNLLYASPVEKIRTRWIAGGRGRDWFSPSVKKSQSDLMRNKPLQQSVRHTELDNASDWDGDLDLRFLLDLWVR